MIKFFAHLFLLFSLAGIHAAAEREKINWQTIRSQVAWLNSSPGGEALRLSVDGTPALIGVPPGGHYDATKFPPGSHTATIEGMRGKKQYASFALSVPAEGSVLLITLPEGEGRVRPLLLENRRTAGRHVFVNAAPGVTLRLLRSKDGPVTLRPGSVESLSRKELETLTGLEVTGSRPGEKLTLPLPSPGEPMVTIVHASALAESFCEVTRFRSENFTVEARASYR